MTINLTKPRQGFTNKQVQAIHTLANTLEPFKEFPNYVKNNSEAVLQNVSQIPVSVYFIMFARAYHVYVRLKTSKGWPLVCIAISQYESRLECFLS